MAELMFSHGKKKIEQTSKFTLQKFESLLEFLWLHFSKHFLHPCIICIDPPRETGSLRPTWSPGSIWLSTWRLVALSRPSHDHHHILATAAKNII